MGERLKYSLCGVTLDESSSRLNVFKDTLLQETSADEAWGGFSLHWHKQLCQELPHFLVWMK